jgi:hypothetical protein
VVIESDDEAHRAAEAIIADIASGDLRAGEEFISLYVEKDALWIGRFLVPLLTEAIERAHRGDVSVETARLVGFAKWMREAVAVSDAETAAATEERAAERRAATLVAMQPAPDIGSRMTGTGLHGLPLPGNAVADGDFLLTRVASPEVLMAFYIEHMRSTGWTLDLDHSNPVTTFRSIVLPPQCYFSRPDLRGRYVAILTGPGIDDPSVTRLSISEHED